MIKEIKPIVFTRHARDRCAGRGTTEADVTKAIRNGKREPLSAACGYIAWISSTSASGLANGMRSSRWRR